MLEILEDYNWSEAFAYADFSRGDVEKVIASREGENDGNPWIMLGKLKDGRYFFLEAGCDYTGWDCQAGGNSYTESRLGVLLRAQITDSQLEALFDTDYKEYW